MPAPRLSVVVTRRLPETVETRMKELFNVELRENDVKMTREELAAAMRRAGVLVPLSALIANGAKQYVMLVNDGVIERRAVATAGERGKDILVTSGLSGGDKLVLDASLNLETNS